MFATVNKSERKKLVAVISESGNLVTRDHFCSIKANMILASTGKSKLVIDSLEGWAEEPGSTPVYEGDTLTLQF